MPWGKRLGADRSDLGENGDGGGPPALAGLSSPRPGRPAEAYGPSRWPLHQPVMAGLLARQSDGERAPARPVPDGRWSDELAAPFGAPKRWPIGTEAPATEPSRRPRRDAPAASLRSPANAGGPPTSAVFPPDQPRPAPSPLVTTRCGTIPPADDLAPAGVAAVRARLDEPAVAAAWTEGEAMTLEQAVAHALGDEE